jgi:hypothetical protein
MESGSLCEARDGPAKRALLRTLVAQSGKRNTLIGLKLLWGEKFSNHWCPGEDSNLHGY